MADNEEGDENLPRDAKIVKALLRSMGVREYEPRVIHQFLELWYRYVVDVLTDSQVYSEHAGKSVIDVDDVKLAIQTKVNFSFSQPPPRERFINMYASTLQNHALLRFIHALFTLYSQILLELARNRNKIPLSKSIDGPGIPLPPEEDTLISPNYQLAIPKKQLPQAAEETEEDEEGVNQDPQEPKTDQQQQQTQQRVSFSLVGKRGGG